MRYRLLATLVVAGLLTMPAIPASATHSVGPGAPSTKGVIVWTQRTDAGIDHLVIADADGSHQRDLTPAIADSGDIDAQVSPDGRWIAYEHDTAISETIHLVRPNGSNDHVLATECTDPCFGFDAPTWLSDHRIAYLKVVGPFDERGDAASAVLWAADTDGTHVRRLSEPGIDGTYEDRYARLSANRRFMTFQRLRVTDSSSALFRMRLDGSHVRQLTPWGINADLYDLSTAESGPTRNLIVFQSPGHGDPDATFSDIGFVPATCSTLADCTSKIVWLTDNAATGRRNGNAQWSPDGHSFVFTDRSSIDEPDAEIWTSRYGSGETQRRDISNSPKFDFRPAWGVAARAR